MLTKKYLDELTYKIIGCCINVQKELGAGLLESVYHRCLEEEFRYQKIFFSSELTIPVTYRNIALNTQLRTDFLIERCLVLELKAVQAILPIHEAQILTYMKLLEVPKGVMVNFNSTNIYSNGQKTYVNSLYRTLK